MLLVVSCVCLTVFLAVSERREVSLVESATVVRDAREQVVAVGMVLVSRGGGLCRCCGRCCPRLRRHARRQVQVEKRKRNVRLVLLAAQGRRVVHGATDVEKQVLTRKTKQKTKKP